MDQKISFIREWESGRYYFNSLCAAYGISRQGGYDLVNRYRAGGFKALADQSRRPITSPSSSSAELVNLVKNWREKKGWGAKKSRVKIIEQVGEASTPSVTTIHNILIRESLVISKKHRRKKEPVHPVYDPAACNEIWSGDYKGSFLLSNKKRCYPLMICDSYTCGYGNLSYWLIDHGIEPVFSDPGRPDQNGRHERMHKDLKARCCNPASKSLRTQNRRMNSFVREYNEERPHEALQMQLPSEVHERSNREWKDHIKPLEYGTDMMVKKVSKNGTIRWGSYESVSISSCLVGKYIGLRKLGNRVWQVFFRKYSLGYFMEGEQVKPGHYYLLDSDKDMNERRREWKD